MSAVRLHSGILLIALTALIQSAPAQFCEFHGIPPEHGLGLLGRANPDGVSEPAVPLYHNGVFVGECKVVEAYDHVLAGTGCFPLTVADIIANTYVRSTYQKADGHTATLGTSIVGSASFRPPDQDLRLRPTVTQADVWTGIGVGERVEVVLQGIFDSTVARVISTRTFPDPPLGATLTHLTVQFEAMESIALNTNQLGSDALRLMTASSMFASETEYDANLLLYEDASGLVHSFRLANNTPRGQHLFPAAIEIGSWFALVKEPGSTYNSGSPSIQVNILDHSGVPGRLGIQGYLYNCQTSNCDSLNVWLEWLDAPATVPAGASLEIDLAVTASGDWHITQEQIDIFVAVLLGLDENEAHEQWADLNCDGETDGRDIPWLVHGLLLP